MLNRRKIGNRASVLRTRAALSIAGTVLRALRAHDGARRSADREPGGSGRLPDRAHRANLVVTAEETVDAAVILNGPALVEGTVRESLDRPQR